MKYVSFIDRHFRQYGEDFFGKNVMDTITDEQVETARCWAFSEAARLTEKYGKLENGAIQELFCNYIFDEYI